MMRLFFLALIVASTNWLSLSAQSKHLPQIIAEEASFLIGGNEAWPLLSLPKEQAFLEIAKSKIRVKDRFASYHFKKQKKALCQKIKVDSLLEQSIKGHFTDCNCRFELKVVVLDDKSYQLGVSISDTSFQEIALFFRSNAKKYYFGAGEQYSNFNLKGHKAVNFTQESGIGRGDKPISKLTKSLGIAGAEYSTHLPIPFFVEIDPNSDEFLSYQLSNYNYSEFDFTNDQFTRIELWDKYLELSIRKENKLANLIEAYTEKTGRMQALPAWAYGTWLGLQGGADNVRQHLQAAKAAGNPVSAIWIQDWVGKRKTRVGWQLWWNWQADEKSYPNFKEFCAEMHAQGVKVLGYINPFLANEGPLYEEAKAKGFLVKNKKGKDYKIKTAGFPAYLVDLTNPAAFDWLKDIVKKNMLENGLDGWMADYSEGLPWDCVLHSGISPREYHNQYPVDFARLNQEAIREANRTEDAIFFMRSGFEHSATYASLFWMGDQLVNWGKNDGIPSTVVAALSSGLSGIAYNHSDIGGYTTVKYPFVKKQLRSQELLQRWTELNVFMPVFRTHEGLKPLLNQQVYSDAESIAFFAKMGRLHKALEPYFEYLSKDAELKGYPLVRPLFWQFPTDANLYQLDNQFMLGDDLLVCPVLEAGRVKQNCYLPEGKWWHPWTDKVYEGQQQLELDAPIGKPLFFVKIGGDWEDRLKVIIEGR